MIDKADVNKYDRNKLDNIRYNLFSSKEYPQCRELSLSVL